MNASCVWHAAGGKGLELWRELGMMTLLRTLAVPWTVHLSF